MDPFIATIALYPYGKGNQILWQAGRQADKIQMRFKILKLAIDQRFSALFSQGTALFLLFNAFLTLFSGESYYKVISCKV